MTSDAVRLLVQLAQAEQDAGRPIPESIAAQLLALVAGMYECTPAARKRRHRVTSASRERPADVPTSVTSASRERDISVPPAAALGRGVGGMGVVVVEERNQKSNSAVQEEPSLDDLFQKDEPLEMVVYQTNRGQLPVVKQAVAAMERKVGAVQRGNARRQRYEDLADAVFVYWKGTYGKPDSVRMDARRRSVIVRALDENEGDLSELFYALDGARKSDFHMGRGKYAGGKKYDTPEAILTDRSRIEGHAEMIGNYGRGVPHPEAIALAALTDTQPQLQGVA